MYCSYLSKDVSFSQCCCGVFPVDKFLTSLAEAILNITYVWLTDFLSHKGVFQSFEVGKIWGTVIVQSVTVSSWSVRHNGKKILLPDLPTYVAAVDVVLILSPSVRVQTNGVSTFWSPTGITPDSVGIEPPFKQINMSPANKIPSLNLSDNVCQKRCLLDFEQVTWYVSMELMKELTWKNLMLYWKYSLKYKAGCFWRFSYIYTIN